ncbi:MAG: tetratricopeptide repeat protein, partial [Bacillota bacterium]
MTNKYKFIIASLILSLLLSFSCFPQIPSNDIRKEKAADFFNQALSYDKKCDYKRALDNYLKAAELQHQTGDKAGLILTYSQIGEIYDTWSDYSKALEYHNMELELSKELKNDNLTALALNNIGLINDTQGKYNIAVEYYQQALKLYEKSKNKKGITEVCLNIGNVNRLLTNFTISFDNFRRALALSEEIGDKHLQADANQFLGRLFFSLRENNKAIEHFEHSLGLYEEIDDLKGKSVTLGYLGLTHNRIKDFKNALEYHKAALKIRRSINDVAGIATSLNNIGDILFNTGKYQEALGKYLESLKIREISGNEYGTFEARRNIGNTYKKLGNYEKALEYLNKSQEFAVRENLKEKIIANDLSISETYLLMKDYKNAYEFLYKYAALKDSVFNKDYKERLTELQIKYDAEKTEKENQLLKTRQSVQDLQLRQQRSQIYALLGFALAGIMITLGMYYRYRLTNKTKQLLEEKNNQIALQKEKLEELNATKDKFFSIISHDLKNPFNTLIGFSELLMSDFNEMSDEEKLSSLKDISVTSQKSYQLLNNLLEWSKIQTGILEPDMHNFDLKEVIGDCSSLIESNAKIKNISIQTEYSGSTIVFADCNIIKAALRNLMTNAVKFTNPGGTIKVGSFHKNGDVIVSIEDNGIGIRKEDLGNLFRIDVQKSTLGTSSEKGTGLGLVL